MRRKNNTIKINKFVLIGIIFLFGAIVVRMGMISLGEYVDGINLGNFASNRNTARRTLYATRGNIYDVNGNILARNVNAYTVIAFLSEERTTNPDNPRHVVDREMTAEKLSEILIRFSPMMTKEHILSLLNLQGYQVELGPGGRDISEITRNEIIALNLPGISFIQGSMRYYPMDNFASYIIGYARRQDDGEIVGEMGIEGYFNSVLKGTDGYTEFQQDAFGFPIPITNPIIKEPISGQSIYLTIDNNIQMILEDSVRGFVNDFSLDWITITIANARTGAILGSASSPSFNPNRLDIENFVNPLVGFAYEPGSTQKIYSWMAAIENGVYDENRKFRSGNIRVGEYIINDATREGWGYITFDEGFHRSSNVAATMLAQRMGRGALRDFYDALGFGQRTGIELPGEVAGRSNFVWDVEVATASFGQGITTTPIQNIQALTAVSNDGVLLKPWIVDRIVDGDGNITFQGGKQEVRRVSSAETARKTRELMWGVVNIDTMEARHARPNNTTLIAKTGTAEIVGPDGRYLTGRYDNIRSLSAMFPYENPEYLFYFSAKRLVASNRQIHQRQAAIVDAVATKNMNINDNIIHVDPTQVITINNFINRDVEMVKEKLIELDVEPIIIGNGDRIINQFPSRNTTIIPGTKVFLITNNNELIMPNVIGWSSNEIKTFANLIGLRYRTSGFGRVEEVNIEPGTQINLNTELIIRFRP